MPYLEFTKIDESGESRLIPDGLYTAQVEEIEEKRTRAGDEMWRVVLGITGGGPTGAQARGRRVIDHWVFSAKALPRMKLIASAFGLDVREDREVSRRDFLGREVEVDVRTRRSPGEGEARFESFIPYSGYRRLELGKRTAGEEEIPF
jgi:hypothetical protein